MRNIMFILGLLLALNINAQQTIPTNIKAKDVAAAILKPSARPQTFIEFCNVQQTSLEKKGGSLTQALVNGQPVYYEGSVVFYVTRYSTKDSVKTPYDQPVIATQKLNADSILKWRWTNVPAKQWAELTKTSSK